MKKALALVLALVMVLSMTVLFASAEEEYTLPTTYGGKTIDWEVTSKTNKPAVLQYYGGVDYQFQGLINVYLGWEGITDEEVANQYQINGLGRYQSDVNAWLHPDDEEAPGGGYLIATYPDVTYTTADGTFKIAQEGLLYIESLSAAEKSAAADEIAYFKFLAEKEQWLFEEANGDKIHEGLDVLPSILRDALDAVKAAKDQAPETSDMVNVVAVFAGITVLCAAVVVLKKKYN